MPFALAGWFYVVMIAAATVSAFAQQPTAAACPSLVEARSLMMQQNWKAAADSLRQNISANAACANAHYLLAYTLLRDNEPDASLKEYTAAAKLRNPTSSEFVGVASDYILLKDYADAERWLERATRTEPVDVQTWYLLGRTQYNLEQNAAAVESFQHSLTVIPEDPKAEYNLGLAYERLQRPDLARAAYQTAIDWAEKKHTPDAQPYLDLGVLDRAQGHADQALPQLQRAAALSPGNPTVFLELGRTLLELKRPDEAIVALKTAAALAPSAEQPHYFLGRAYRAAGKAPEADQQFAIVQKLAGSHSSTTTPNADGRRAEVPQ
ncbi:tetratricopeptide repeat protein [Terriglobus aquaticus]|nr:tetratricopeptide repeat protein [Terriglobus aquaticus]